MSLINQIDNLIDEPIQLLELISSPGVDKHFGLVAAEIIDKIIHSLSKSSESDKPVYSRILEVAVENAGSNILIPLLESFDPEILNIESASHVVKPLSILLNEKDHYSTSLVLSSLYHFNKNLSSTDSNEGSSDEDDGDGPKFEIQNQEDVSNNSVCPLKVNFISSQLSSISPKLKIVCQDDWEEINGDIFYYYAKMAEAITKIAHVHLGLQTQIVRNNIELIKSDRLKFEASDSKDGLADNLIGSFIHQFDLFLHSNFLSIKILNSLKSGKISTIQKFEEEWTEESFYSVIPLLYLQHQFQSVLTHDFLFRTFSTVFVACLRSRNGFVAQTSLLLMQRLLDPIKTATGLDNGNQIFQALAACAIHQPLRYVRLNALRVLNGFMNRIDYRTLYSIFISSLGQDANEKIVSFLIPRVKDFLISPLASNIDQSLIWDRILLNRQLEITRNIDTIMPVLNLIRAIKLQNKIPNQAIKDKIDAYLKAIETDVVDGTRFYKLEMEKKEPKSDLEKKQNDFNSQCLMQIELINSILQLAKQ